MSDQAYYDSPEIKKKMQNQLQNPYQTWSPIPQNNQSAQHSFMSSHDIILPTEEKTEGKDMAISREELDAKLAQNKAEVQAIASGMREEMAHWREEQNAQMNKVITTLSVLDVKLDERYENQKTASTRTQWLIGLAIAVAAIIPAVIALVK